MHGSFGWGSSAAALADKKETARERAKAKKKTLFANTLVLKLMGNSSCVSRRLIRLGSKVVGQADAIYRNC